MIDIMCTGDRGIDIALCLVAENKSVMTRRCNLEPCAQIVRAMSGHLGLKQYCAPLYQRHDPCIAMSILIVLNLIFTSVSYLTRTSIECGVGDAHVEDPQEVFKWLCGRNVNFWSFG